MQCRPDQKKTAESLKELRDLSKRFLMITQDLANPENNPHDWESYAESLEDERRILGILDDAITLLDPGDLPPQVHITGDDSVSIRINPSTYYEVFNNGELVAVKKSGEVTSFHEWKLEDLTPETTNK
jgi:C1A family cysteine protease